MNALVGRSIAGVAFALAALPAWAKGPDVIYYSCRMKPSGEYMIRACAAFDRQMVSVPYRVACAVTHALARSFAKASTMSRSALGLTAKPQPPSASEASTTMSLTVTPARRRISEKQRRVAKTARPDASRLDKTRLPRNPVAPVRSVTASANFRLQRDVDR